MVSHTKDATTSSYNNIYTYGNTLHPNALTKITNGTEEETFTYDANGNVITHIKLNDPSRQMLWDESNRLKALLVTDESVHHYIYDAAGERTLKGRGNIMSMMINGELQNSTASIGNYAEYVSPYFVIGANARITKHYYVGTERIMSRIVDKAVSAFSMAPLTGTQNSTLTARQLADVQYSFTEFGLGTVSITNESSNDCETQGNCPSTLYYFHPDHVGSSTFITDENGQAYQFMLYLPFGESMADQKAGGYSTKYRFNGKELDAETGLYYYGARYYDPRISLWYGVDPMAEKYTDYSAYTYTNNNPIRFIDPNGQDWYEDECSGDIKWFEGNGKQDGFIHRGTEYMKAGENFNTLYTVDDMGNPYFGASSNEVEIKGSDWSHTLYKATENFFGVTEAELHDPESDAVSKIMKKEASIALNILSIGEGTAAISTGSKMKQIFTAYGMINDALSLEKDLTGVDLPEFVLGSFGAKSNTFFNSVVGLAEGYPKFGFGNVGDVLDLNDLINESIKKK